MVWFVLLVLWPLAELFVIVKVSEAVGFLWMLLLLIVSWPVGSRIIRHEGRAALRRLRDAVSAGRAPTDEVLDGGLVLAGGLLLLVPGFITDALGLLLLLRPTRAVARRAARNHHIVWLTRAVSLVTWGIRGDARRGNNAHPHGGRGSHWREPGRSERRYDVDGTAVDIDEPRLSA